MWVHCRKINQQHLTDTKIRRGKSEQGSSTWEDNCISLGKLDSTSAKLSFYEYSTKIRKVFSLISI